MSNSFELEGIELRARQKLVDEDFSQSKEIILDHELNAKIFVNKGELYFQSYNLKEPISLSKTSNFIEHIITDEEGILRFYNSDFSKYVTLSQLVDDSLSFYRENSVIYNALKQYAVDSSFNTFRYLNEQYRTDYTSNIPQYRYELGLIDFTDAYVDIDNNFISNGNLSELLDNYLLGMTVEISTNPSSPAFFDENIMLLDKFDYLNNESIGFYESDEDYEGRVYFFNRSLKEFDEFLFSKLYEFNDIGKALYWYIGELQFTNTALLKYDKIIKNEIAKAVSNTIISNFMESVNSVLVDNAYIDPNTKTFYDQIFMRENRKQFEDVLWGAFSDFLNRKTDIISEVDAIVAVALGDTKNSVLNLANYSEITFGKRFTEDNFYLSNLFEYRNQWFDVEPMYLVTEPLQENMGISVLASFNAKLKHGEKVKYEFRLFDSVTQTELDKVVAETQNLTSYGVEGDVYQDRIETIPIQLGYSGPIPYVSCEARTFDKVTSVKDIRMLARLNSKETATFNINKGFNSITNRLGGYNPIGTKSDVVNVETPRLFRIQWRMVVEDAYTLRVPHIDGLGSISFDNYNDLFDFSYNVYNFENSNNQKIIKQGVVQFNNEQIKRVQGVFGKFSNQYSLSLESDRNVSLWYSDKTNDGFTINTSKKINGEVSWLVSKQQDAQASKPEKKIPTCLVEYNNKYVRSNFEIFRDFGYEVNLGVEDTSNGVLVNEDLTFPIEQEQQTGTFVDIIGVGCSEECVDDCPDGYICSGECPNAVSTESGCACCECIDDSQCLSGQTCISGTCV